MRFFDRNDEIALLRRIRRIRRLQEELQVSVGGGHVGFQRKGHTDWFGPNGPHVETLQRTPLGVSQSV